MNSSDLYERFRSDVYDTASPYLWSDVEVFQYMDAAQKMLCRLAGGIADATSTLTQVPVVATEAWVSYDPRILKITRANRLSDYKKLDVLNVEDLDRSGGSDDYGVTRTYKMDMSTGPLEAVVTNLEAKKIRLIKVPEANDTLQLAVYRLPLVTINDTDLEFEVDEVHHEYLLYWMKKLAFSKQDAETRNDKQAELNELRFRQYCEQVRQERERREHKPRLVSYGGL